MRVLVTRPEAAARRTAARLQALGHKPVLLPLFRPVFDADAVRQARDGRWSALAATSAQAARALDDVEDAASMLSRQRLYAVGQATAEAFAQRGFADIRVAEGDAASLVKLILDDRAAAWPMAAPDRPIAYLAGRPRGAVLEQGLRQGGIAAAALDVYRMAAIDYPADDLGNHVDWPNIDAVLLYSQRTAARFAALFDGWEGARVPALLCLSAQVANAVPRCAAARVRVAARPDEASLLALLNGRG